MSNNSVKIQNGLFIFRRDLRVEDNTGLIHASKLCKEKLYCCFIFTPEQITGKNRYKSDASVLFMMESLMDLQESLRAKGGELFCFYGSNSTVLRSLIQTWHIDAVFFNQDYTPYARERDDEIQKMCDKMKIPVEMYQDYNLYVPSSVLTGSGGIYKKFTPFYEKVLHIKVEKVSGTFNTGVLQKNGSTAEHRLSLTTAKQRFVRGNPSILVHGGRDLGKKQLFQSRKTQNKYATTRNIFNIHTSVLSPYLKFGCISVREVYFFFKNTFGIHSEILRQLIWREFYAHVLFGEPGMIDLSKNNRLGIQWSKNHRWFEMWCTGHTGYPIVDAAMRQLNQTGWMHNRGRLVVGIFLVKVLLIDWRWGEQYFAQKLVDYDIASNNGNWQWVASTGADSMPYFRTMNPWTQALQYDPQAEYIKQWVPELKEVEVDDIHRWNKRWGKYKHIQYPKPMVDFSEQRLKSLALYKK